MFLIVAWCILNLKINLRGGILLSLQFTVGAGNCDHQSKMIDQALQWLERKNSEVFFIVPNYNKFEREQEILLDLKRRQGQKEFSTIRAQVYSFHRLAWYFLQSSGEYKEKNVSEAGSAMLMRKVLSTISNQLTMFRGEIAHAGFIDQLLKLYQEFQMGNITFDQLSVQQKQTSGSSQEKDFQLKMKELQLIFSAYEQELLDRNISVESPIETLTRYVSQSIDTKDSTVNNQLKRQLFLISGFSSFSAQEQNLLCLLMENSSVCIDLLVDSPNESNDPLALFFESRRTYQELLARAHDQQVPVLQDQYAPLLKEASEDYLALERTWRKSSSSNVRQPLHLGNFLRIWCAQTPEEELRHVALEIRRLVVDAQSEEKLRYRDIQLLTLSPEIYTSLLPTIFDEMDIPYYIDEEKKMEEHPLVEFILSLFSLEKYHYRQTDVLRFLRTELYIPLSLKKEYSDWKSATKAYRFLVDLTENKSLAYNYHGTDWTNDEPWQLLEYDFEAGESVETKQMEEKINFIRSCFLEEIVPFFKEIKAAKTNREGLFIFYQFLLRIGVDKQLICWRDQEIERGNLDQARNHEQTWQALMDLFDEFVEISGEDPFDFELFEEVLTSGLSNFTFGKIPTAIDQVQINPLDLARPQQSKVTFAIGLDETTFPRQVENKTLLSIEERQRINENLQDGQFLRDRAGETIRKEPFVAYNLFLSAHDKLYLSYAANYDTTKNIKPSPYLTRLLHTTDCQLEKLVPIHLEADPKNYVGSYRNLIRQLNYLMRQTQEENSTLSPKWQTLKQILLASDWHTLASRVFDSQSELNTPVSLQTKTALELYGKDIYSSISRMETFYQCEYQYYMKYGLRLKERDLYGLNAAVTGEFFHEALDQFLSLLIEKNISLLTLTDQKRELLVDTLLQKVFGQGRYSILNRTKRMNFIRYQLGATIKRVTWALKKQSERTQLSPVQTEVLFGQIAGKKGLKDLQFPLNNGANLHLRGKIDRIDTAVSDGKPWLSVIDYKSSSRSFDLTENYYGLALQLVTYLDVALTDAVELIGRKDAKIAGAYYLHVHDPILDASKASEKERLKQFKYDGLFVDNPELFEIYDHQLETKENSLLFPIQKDKNDQVKMNTKSKDKFYSEQDIQLLIAHNRRKMIEGGNRILTGDISLNPSFKVKDKKRACEFCPFRSICQFDVMLKENNYHRIENLTKEQIMDKIREGEEND